MERSHCKEPATSSFLYGGRDSLSKYRQCCILEQAYDPDAIGLLTLTLAPGMKDQYDYTGDTTEQFTMGIEAQARRVPLSMHPEAIGPIPEETVRVARAAFPRGNTYMAY